MSHKLTARVLLCLAAILVLGTGRAGADNRASIIQQTGKDLYVAGRDVAVESRIEGDLTATGISVVVSPDTEIGGNAWIASRRAALQGVVRGNLDLRVQDALINGLIEGDVSFVGMKLSLGPEAVIEGDLSYLAGHDAEIDAAAQIKGTISQQMMGFGGQINKPGVDVPGEDELGGSDPAPPIWDGREGWPRHGWYFEDHRRFWPGYGLSASGAVILGFLAALISFVAPSWTRAVQRVMDKAPAASFLMGVAWLIAVPFAAVVMALTVVGLPLAVFLLGLYALGFLAGLIAAILVIGGWIVGLFGQRVRPDGGPRILVVVLGVLVLWGAVSLPWAGGLAWALIVTGGVGALLMAGRERFKL